MRRIVGMLALFVSCGDGGGGPVASWTENQAYLLDGFGFRWQERPHRINRIGVELGTQARLTLEGGSWATGEEASDKADTSVFYSSLSSAAVKIYGGSSSSMTLQEGAADKTVSLTVKEIGLADCAQFAVLLRGFDLDTDVTHVDGYTVRGIGAGVDEVNLADGVVSFRVRLRLEAGAVPDRIQNLENYGATGKVHYTVVGISGGKITETSHSYELKYAAGVDPSQPHASEAQRKVTIQGDAGFGSAFVGLASFDFRLNESAALFPGRYMREIQVRSTDYQYDAAAGAMTFRCDGYFSNSGPIAWELENDFRASFAMIQVAEGTWTHRSATATQAGLDTFLTP